MALLSHGIGGIHWVRTLKHARRGGLAEHCVVEVGNETLAGARKIILQASAVSRKFCPR